MERTWPPQMSGTAPACNLSRPTVSALLWPKTAHTTAVDAILPRGPRPPEFPNEIRHLTLRPKTTRTPIVVRHLSRHHFPLPPYIYCLLYPTSELCILHQHYCQKPEWPRKGDQNGTIYGPHTPKLTPKLTCLHSPLTYCVSVFRMYRGKSTHQQPAPGGLGEEQERRT